MTRYPIQDQVAIVGVGTTGFTRAADRSSLDLSVEASVAAIRDAGLTAADIDGICAVREPGAPTVHQTITTLGLEQVTHQSAPTPIAMFSVIDAMHAVFSGLCEYVLVTTPVLQLPWVSRKAAMDPFRNKFRGGVQSIPEKMDMAAAYAGWAGRYLHDHGVDREVFGRLAVNMRTNALDNPLAAIDKPLTMDDYYAGRMIREPLGMFDMDLPCDGADALVFTTAENAKKLPQPPVLMHAATAGMIGNSVEDQMPSLDRHGQHVVVESLKARSDIWLDDIDVFLPYDGFTIITTGWFENCGWCGPGEATQFVRDHWDEDTNRIMINGRIPVNPHGGSLSEGATRGTGHVREAVVQLRGQAEGRQAQAADGSHAKTALVTPGGFFFNSQGAILRAG